jgi:hypothetical protein
MAAILSPFSLYGGIRKTKLPLLHNRTHTPRGTLVKTSYFSSRGHAFAAIRVLPTQAPRSRHVSSNIEASRRVWIPFLPAEPPVLVLWLNEVTWRFCGEPPQTSHADSGCEPLPCTGHVHNFVLLFLPSCGPHLIPFGHLVHRANPTFLSTPRRPCKDKTFRAYSSPAPTQIKLQPAPTILSQESVHFTLSITHHTRERPSSGPWMLRPTCIYCLV